MSNKKEMVAIDKEQWNYIVDKLTKDVPDSNKEAFLKAVNPIEIQIDQSIEEDILYKKFFAITPQPSKEANLNGLKFESWDKEWTESLAKKFVQIAKDFATSQQIIEQLRVKEKECSKCEPISGFYLGTTCPECGKPFRSVKS